MESTDEFIRRMSKIPFLNEDSWLSLEQITKQYAQNPPSSVRANYTPEQGEEYLDVAKRVIELLSDPEHNNVMDGANILTLVLTLVVAMADTKEGNLAVAEVLLSSWDMARKIGILKAFVRGE